MGYVLGFHGLIDLIAILPFFLQSFLPGLDLRFLRVLRIMRILKLSHYSTALEDLIASIYAEISSFISALYLLALSILITSCLMYYAEHQLQPDKFGTIPDAMWWSIITITTVGYGDVVPITPLGKILASATALLGLVMIALPMSPNLQVADMNIGVLYVTAVSGLGVLGILLGGWSSNNKWSLLGAMRAGAQIISYEVSATLALLVVVLFAGTLQLSGIVQAVAGTSLFRLLDETLPGALS